MSVRATTPHPIPPVPPDLAAALALAPGGRRSRHGPRGAREVLGWLNQAKAADTRARRIRIILERLGV